VLFGEGNQLTEGVPRLDPCVVQADTDRVLVARSLAVALDLGLQIDNLVLGQDHPYQRVAL
jgi:hypothetical protein